VLRAQEPLAHRVVEEAGERVVVAADVEQPARLVVDAELAPRVDLDQLLERADAARQRHERVRQLRHLGLALVHRADDLELGQVGMADLAVDQRLRHDADRLAARGQHGVGDHAHQADLAAAVDEPDAARGELGGEGAGAVGVGGIGARIRTGVDADAMHPGRFAGMDTTTLGPLTVSRLALGCMLMGGDTPADDAYRILDRFVDAGGTLIDTADTYGDGTSERTLAPWLARRRDDVLVATKVRFAVSDPGGEGLAPDRIRAACDASLRRLGIDVIDLYQVHGPDETVPLEETLEALDGLVQAGKVRALGVSNFPAWLLAWAVAVQDRHGWSPFVSLQPQYSLVERTAEIELLPFTRAAGLGVLPWGPLGAGFLTGRYKRDAMPAGRVTEAPDDLEEAPHRRAIERNFRVIDAAEAIAAAHGATVPQVALAWLLGVEGVTAPIIGPRTYEHLEDVLGAVDVKLSEDEHAALAAPAPPPETSPQRMLSQQLGLTRVALPLR
jgi:aryl-alcohol dehydrogenase-like predicted oxidoreductase